MSVKVGINGFGRIGRNILRSALQQGMGELDLVAINDLTDAATLAHLFKYDSVHGVYDGQVEVDGNALVIDGERFDVLSVRNPAELPWADLGADVIFEATGLFRKRVDAAKHLDAGARKVVITAPAPDPDVTLVLGVNGGDYDPAIHDIILTFPEGYNTVVGEKGVTLSGGQRQRVAIARALLKDPRILVLDDATSSVDTETEEQIQAALDRLMAGRTTFLVAHRIQTVMSADLILVLDKGAVVQGGTHAELVQQDGLYRDIFDIQSQIDEEVRHEVEFEPSATVT